KIEAPPASGFSDNMAQPRDGYEAQNLHRNKRGMTLNLREERGREIFFRMVKDADVVIENYRPDVKHRLGVDYEACRAVNPRIVYGSISGFGQEGPYHRRPGLDMTAQGLSGLMSITGKPGDGPMRVGIPLADLSAGFMLAQGIMIALLEREVSGEGQWVHTSLLEAQIQMMDFQAARYLLFEDVPTQQGNNHPTFLPAGVFETADGRIIIQSGPQHLWERLVRALEMPELLENPDYASVPKRFENKEDLHETITRRTRTKPGAEWIDILNEAGIPCGPIYTVDETFADPQVKGLNMSPEVEHPEMGAIKIVGQAVKLTRTPQKMRNATPEVGAHTEEILKDLGYDADAIRQLRDEGIV
ncbi:MAG: CoA transferase, partial [Nitrospinae bacterium]|nr:CoA transferase [Nitrospinota bacterium]